MPQEFDPQKEIDDETLKEIEDYLKLPIIKKEKGYEECKHLRVILDEEDKTVTCEDCKKQLDAFWYLSLLAKEWKWRRYQDYEAIKAYRKLEEEDKKREAKIFARRKNFSRPSTGNGMDCWDSYESLYEHPPEYVFYHGGWYAGENGGHELFDVIKMQLASKKNTHKSTKNEFIDYIEKHFQGNLSKYVIELIYNEGFKNGRDYPKENST